MHKRKISFVNPNFNQGPKEFNAYYLPYTSAVLWAYASQFEHISTHIELGEFIWHREPIEDVVERLKDHDIVALSTYIWNRNYNHVLGRALKLANPDILILSGGPEPPITNPKFFELFPYIDICSIQEGEKSLKAILEHYLDGNTDYTDIKGLLINVDGKAVNTGNPDRISDLDTIPSPYLVGMFDHLFEKHPEVRWNVTLETNRGCPYMCTFCDWGSLTYSKVKKFDETRVYKELEWIGQKGCDFVSITDANFGIFPERDMAIARKLVEVQQQYNNPKAYTISWAKNQKKEVVDIVKMLIYEGGSKIGLNLSVQSMDEHTLEVIKRKNLDTNKIEEVFDMCEENNIPLYTELILGLPGETLDTWKENFYRLYKAGNHTGITVYQAQLLENAEMNLTQREKYQLKGQIVYDYLVGTYNEHEVREGIEVVTSTIDLPIEKMNEAQVFSWFQNTFHINGITNYISRVLCKKYGIEYSQFYTDLLEYIKTDEWLNSELERISEHYANWNTEGAIDHVPIQGIEIHGWNLIHSTIINLANLDMHDHVFNVLEEFLKTTYEFLPESLLNDLMTVQRNYLIKYNGIQSYPRLVELKHDIFGYVQNMTELDSAATYHFDFPEDTNMSLQQFCEQIFFARRRNFGKAWVTKL
jgi:radical SAM superfamily enzyme YgiQ (UPF0313 family)